MFEKSVLIIKGPNVSSERDPVVLAGGGGGVGGRTHQIGCHQLGSPSDVIVPDVLLPV